MEIPNSPGSKCEEVLGTLNHLPGPRNGVFASCHDLRSPFPTVTTNDLGTTSDSRRSSVCADFYTPPPGKLAIPYTRGIQPAKHMQLSFFLCAEKLRARYQGFTCHSLNTCTQSRRRDQIAHGRRNGGLPGALGFRALSGAPWGLWGR